MPLKLKGVASEAIILLSRARHSESVFLIIKTLYSVQQEPSHTTENRQFWHMTELFPFLLASFMKMKDQQT